MNRLAKNLNTVIPLLGDDHEVADMLGVHSTTVWRWRNGKTIPPDEVIIDLATRLAMDPGTIRYGDACVDSCGKIVGCVGSVGSNGA